MPYITEHDRLRMSISAQPKTPGELNYLITKIVTDYLKYKGFCYETLNEAVGVLECAKLELYRRVIAPYEDIKKEGNGDVY